MSAKISTVRIPTLSAHPLRRYHQVQRELQFLVDKYWELDQDMNSSLMLRTMVSHTIRTKRNELNGLLNLTFTENPDLHETYFPYDAEELFEPEPNLRMIHSPI